MEKPSMFLSLVLVCFSVTSALGQNTTCQTEYPCTTVGLFPQCNTCQSGYFRCEESNIGLNVAPLSCNYDLVFDTNPQYPYCVKRNKCPSSNATTSDPAGTTVAPPSTDTCLTSLTCTAIGNFPACPDICDPRYFNCQAVNGPGTLKICDEGRVFNTNPDYPYCFLPTNCPFSPPR